MGKKKRGARRTPDRRWATRVTRESDALDLEDGVFTRRPREVAKSLQRSARRRTGDRSRARSDYQAAMSMLTFYINRAGKNLSDADRERLEQAKVELRRLYGRE